MKNIINVDAACALPRRLAAKIPDARAAARFVRLAGAEGLLDERNLRLATASEIAAAPAWAHRENALGRPVHVFCAHANSVARLRRVARALADACLEIQDLERSRSEFTHPREAALIASGREFLDKVDRMTFSVMATKARFFARLRKHRLEEASAADALFAEEAVFASPGRVWRRITSVRQLWETGREFGNCLARNTRQAPGFTRRLRDGDAQFWVLRDQRGGPLMVAMACTLTARIAEARGVRNAAVPSDDADLASLAQARGWSIGGERQRCGAPPRQPGAVALSTADLDVLIEHCLPRRT